LSPDSVLVDPKKPVQVVWNRSDIRSVDFGHGSVTLDVAGYKAPVNGKTPARFGRMDDVFRTPFAIVVGTQSTDPTMRRFIERASDQIVAWWRQWQHVVPPVFLDTALSDADMAKYSLVLIGGPAENLVSQKLAGYIPLKVQSDGFEIDGQHYAATDALAQVVYPHPTNPDRYVAEMAP